MNSEARRVLEGVRAGEVSVDEALLKLKTAPFDDLGYAKVDLHRKARQGAAEVIFGEGKTASQIEGIVASMQAAGQGPVIVTRLDAEKAAYLGERFDIAYSEAARLATVGSLPEPYGYRHDRHRHRRHERHSRRRRGGAHRPRPGQRGRAPLRRGRFRPASPPFAYGRHYEAHAPLLPWRAWRGRWPV